MAATQTCQATLPTPDPGFRGFLIIPTAPTEAVIPFNCPNLPPIQRQQLGGSYNLVISREISTPFGPNTNQIIFTVKVQTRPELRTQFGFFTGHCNESTAFPQCFRGVLTPPEQENVGILSVNFFGPPYQCNIAAVDRITAIWQLPNLGVTYRIVIGEIVTGDLDRVESATVTVSNEATITGEANAVVGDPFEMEALIEEQDEDEPIQPGPLNAASSRNGPGSIARSTQRNKLQKKPQKIRSCMKPNRPAFCIRDCIKQITPTPTPLGPNQEQVPNITIRAETIHDQMDVGLVTMTVRDTISYECIFLPPNEDKDPCFECPERVVNRSEVIETVFQRFIDFNLVVEGEGCTLKEKINFLKAKLDIPVTAVELFLRVVLYGALKYVLSRLLYGFFDARFLLRKYNKRFLRNLSNSRFCQFLNAFASPELRGIGCLFHLNIKKGKRDKDQDFIFKDTGCEECKCKCDDNAINIHKHK
ncbi:Hypothetical protein POVR1_LOCUS411 [uncultured virus]|nr:Hypothetical protein POVR1_LOCUS411 [uncultured virus]